MGNDVSLQDGLIVQEIVKRILPEARVMLFGSRVTGTHRPASDLDVAIDIGRPIPLDVFSVLRLAFSESSLPYFVDLVDWYSISDEFRQAVEGQLVFLFGDLDKTVKK